jgi:quinol monooxygenase YgiN
MVEVRKEKGCIEYFPAIDIPVDLPSQVVDENVVTVLEKWDTMEALKAHLVSPHMQAYRVMVKDMIEDVQLKILKEAQNLG